jgi:hypothetical protein
VVRIPRGSQRRISENKNYIFRFFMISTKCITCPMCLDASYHPDVCFRLASRKTLLYNFNKINKLSHPKILPILHVP